MGSGPRFPRERVAPEADRLLSVLGDRVVACGSYRRNTPVMGDIDLVCVRDQHSVPELLINAGVTLVSPGVPRWEFALPVPWMSKPVKVDVWFPRPERVGACLVHATGSGMHNVLMRRFGISRGLRFTWFGVERIATGENVAGETEESVFEALNWPMLPPEEREDVLSWAAPLMDSLNLMDRETRGEVACDAGEHRR